MIDSLIAVYFMIKASYLLLKKTVGIGKKNDAIPTQRSIILSLVASEKNSTGLHNQIWISSTLID